MPRKRHNKGVDAEKIAHRVGLIADAEELSGFVGLLKRTQGLRPTECAGFPRDQTPEYTTWRDDQRVLIAQGEIDCVVVAASPRRAVAVGGIALDHGVALWRRPPLGRNFAEAVEVARRLRTAQSIYRIASWWELVSESIESMWRETFENNAGLVSEIRINSIGPDRASWCSTLAEAGGGIMIQDAYPMLEMLCALRGLPVSVSGWIGQCRGSTTGLRRETEDAAGVLLRYSDGGAALIRATWDVPPYRVETSHYGPLGALHLEATSVIRHDSRGEVIEARPLPQVHLEWELQHFAEMIAATTDAEMPHRGLDRHLMVSAVLEALYLSARTGQPEDPRRLFEVQKWPEPAD